MKGSLREKEERPEVNHKKLLLLATARKPRSEFPSRPSFLEGEAIGLCVTRNSEISLVYLINERQCLFIRLSLQGQRPEGFCDGDMV